MLVEKRSDEKTRTGDGKNEQHPLSLILGDWGNWVVVFNDENPPQ